MAKAINIVHPKHGAAHCDESQLRDMESEGWSVDKDGDGKKDKAPKGKKSEGEEDKDGDGKK